ncbi:MAG: aldehyde dehydrogenase family protein [Betaproteobacteria bacterium]|nr:aldehyde dehydrogenase family protein [Betaproteobacteria bacterium]
MSALAPLPVRNPRTGQIDYHVPARSREEVRAIASDLRTHSRAWEAMGAKARGAVLLKWRDEIAKRQSAIFDALVTDTGRVRESQLEVPSVLGNISKWAARAETLIADAPTRASATVPMTLTPASVPVGVVAVVSPWNFPLLLALIDAVPALMAGCTVMVKPSEITPRFCVPLIDAIRAVPALANVLAIATGGPDTGAAMIDHADAVCFTGSVATGKVIARHAAERLIPVFLELGGKDAAIVLKDADIAHAARAIAWGGLANAGQSCLSVERVLVDRAIENEFTRALTDEVKRLRFCFPDANCGEIGPIIATRQADTIRAQLDEAKARGAVALTGGALESLGGGLWCQPTVLTNVTPDLKVMADETFGPVLPVMAFDTDEEAIALANGTEFGLSGAVFGERAHAEAVARELECGAISINDAALTAVVHEGEKQAFKASGLGPSRMGDASIARFRKQRVLIENPTLQRNPWWFPPST